MRSKLLLFFYTSFVISFYCVSSSSSSSAINPNVLNDTLKLLADGETKIQLLPHHKDIVLVIGNSGAGKTTITKFLTTDGSDMEAYRKGGRILIRDKAGKIGTNSTVKSQTIYPELMIHPETGVAFYDMPGFADTRNVAIPIANAFFMKKVAEHADRVKIVFVVSHNSVLAGGYRGDFLNMIKGANGLIKDIRKFSPGVALIVTKVNREEEEGIPEIVQYVAEFLEEVREAVPKVMEKAEEQERAIDLLDSLFLLGGNIAAGSGRNSTRSNEKIGIFLQPTKLGPLVKDPEVQKSGPLLKSIIFNKTEFVNASASDFGIIVDPQVQVLVSNLSRQVLDQLHNFSKSLAQVLQKHYENMTISVRGTQSLAQRLSKDLTRLQIEVLELGRSNSVSGFISYLLRNDTFPEIPEKKRRELFPEMRKLNSRLRFFEEIVEDSSVSGSSGLDIWLAPFAKVMRFVHEQKLWKLKESRHDLAHGYAKKGYWLCSLSLLIPPSSLFGCPIGVAIAHKSLKKLEEKQELVYHRKK